MTPDQINRALKKMGVTKVSVAKECGCSHTLVYEVVKGNIGNRDIQMAIARKLGKDVSTVFGPDKYDRSKSSKRRGKSRNYPRLKVQWHEFN